MGKVLVCDNEADTRKFMKYALEKAGHNVVTASDGKSCIKAWEDEKPDVILVDLMMPDLSGWDVAKKILDHDNSQRIAFISALEASDERKRSLRKLGIIDYILKPVTAEDLVDRVERILEIDEATRRVNRIGYY